jgi:hypothetical protein
MKINLVYKNSGDTLPVDVKYNHSLIEWYIHHANATQNNYFSDFNAVANKINPLLTSIHWSVCKTNEVLYKLARLTFDTNVDLNDYLDQNFLNKQHSDWVQSQKVIVDIDALKASPDVSISETGWKLHDMFDDSVREIPLAVALTKIGYIFSV